MHTRAPSVARHLWVARANPGPRTYVCTSRPSPARPTLYSARLERYRYPYLVASSRTSAPVTHRRSSDPLPDRPFVSPLLHSLSLSLSLSLTTAPSTSSPLSIPAILSDRKASLLCIPIRSIRYGTDRRRGVLCRTVLAFIPTDVPRYRRDVRLLTLSRSFRMDRNWGACLLN